MGKHKGKQDGEWSQAKRRCRLSDEEIRMAKELGFKPRSLIKNIPAKSQRWKAPVSEWIRSLHAKRFGEARGSRLRDEGAGASGPSRRPPADLHDEDLLPQYDTVNEEPYFVRESDGRAFSLEEAGQYFLDREAARKASEEEDLLDEKDDNAPEC